MVRRERRRARLPVFTTFAFSDLAAEGRKVSFVVSNTGTRPGTAVPQLYVEFPSDAGEPPLQLAGFAKVKLGPGEAKPVTVTLELRSLQVWDEVEGDWKVPPGAFKVRLGESAGALLAEAQL